MQEQKLLSKKWQKRFEIIDSLEIKSVSGFYAALRTATFKDRLAAQFKMGSILAFLFGPLYYLILGMWRKALFLVGLGMVIGLLNGSIYYAVYGDYVEGEEGYFSSVLRFEVIAFQFLVAYSVVFDYYAKMKINDRGWIIAVLRKPISVVAVPIKVPARRVLDLESNEGPIGNTEMDKLAKLHELKEKDILTEEEFLVEKRKILKLS